MIFFYYEKQFIKILFLSLVKLYVTKQYRNSQLEF